MSEEKNLRESLDEFYKILSKMDTVSPSDIPNIDLYMDQVTTFMDSHLRATLRHPNEDKVLTKTMINNYAKNDLISTPVKKKYNREHMLELLFIFYFKSFLSISDIQTLITPLIECFYGKEDGVSLEQVYEEILANGKGARKILKEDVEERFKVAEGSFEKFPEENREYLKKFEFICELGYDIFLKKALIEYLIDGMSDMSGE